MYGVDGFRIDTTRHVNIEFWHAFAPAMQQAAKDKGIEHFIAFGEVADGRLEVLSCFTTEGRLQSVLDFGFQKAARAFASRSGSADQFRPFFESDDYYTDADSDVYTLPTFLGNHDMGRFDVWPRSTPSMRGSGRVLFHASVDHSDYRLLGIDRSPPYRLFLDPSQFPEGSRLNIQAHFEDTFGGSCRSLTVCASHKGVFHHEENGSMSLRALHVLRGPIIHLVPAEGRSVPSPFLCVKKPLAGPACHAP